MEKHVTSLQGTIKSILKSDNKLYCADTSILINWKGQSYVGQAPHLDNIGTNHNCLAMIGENDTPTCLFDFHDMGMTWHEFSVSLGEHQEALNGNNLKNLSNVFPLTHKLFDHETKTIPLPLLGRGWVILFHSHYPHYGPPLHATSPTRVMLYFNLFTMTDLELWEKTCTIAGGTPQYQLWNVAQEVHSPCEEGWRWKEFPVWLDKLASLEQKLGGAMNNPVLKFMTNVPEDYLQFVTKELRKINPLD